MTIVEITIRILTNTKTAIIKNNKINTSTGVMSATERSVLTITSAIEDTMFNVATNFFLTIVIPGGFRNEICFWNFGAATAQPIIEKLIAPLPADEIRV